MSAWWMQKKTAKVEADPKRRAVAYYRHSAEIGQENSVEIQQDNVRAFAAKHGLEIIEEYHPPYTRDEVIQTLRRSVAEAKGRWQPGRYSAAFRKAARRLFGSWQAALDAAGVARETCPNWQSLGPER
jgi:hypothetical protein